MNITVLEKLEKGWISLEWKTYLPKTNLSDKQLCELVDKLDNWKSNRKCREIILIKYKSMPAYITLKREDFKSMGNWLMGRLTELEMYEECAKLHSIKNKL
jgi:hypothetical protein